jgi:NAD dependent epimerase/dehydratase family enzyme
MLTPFKFALGGVIGSGNQYMSWVGIDEVTHVIDFILNNKSISGPVNVVSQNPVTNHEFTKTLGKALSRPTPFPMPAFVARLLFGEMGDALLLTSIRVSPDKLANAGYKFINNNLLETFNSVLNK